MCACDPHCQVVLLYLPDQFKCWKHSWGRNKRSEENCKHCDSEWLVIVVMKCVAAMSTASRISVLLFGVAVAVFMVNRNIVNKNKKVRNFTKSVLIMMVIFG